MENKKFNWRKAILSHNSTIKEAVQNLIDTSLQIVLVISSSSKLIGTITDGDIRRGLLSGVNLEDKIDKIMKRNPFVVTNQFDEKTIKYLMKVNSLLQLPVVNKHKKIIGLHLWNNLLNADVKNNTVVIMAGGFGKRMLPITKFTPKPMIKVRGKPILEHIIINIRECGFKDIIITTHYLSESIRSYLGNGNRLGVNINYFEEKKPLGTAGCLRSIKFKNSKPIIVTNGDVISDINFTEILDFHFIHKADATMAIRTLEHENPFGVIKSNGIEIIDIEEKPISKSTVNAGIYVINQNTLKVLTRNENTPMTDFFLNLKKKKKKLIAFPVHESWNDIGKPSDVKKRNKKK